MSIVSNLQYRKIDRGKYKYEVTRSWEYRLPDYTYGDYTHNYFCIADGVLHVYPSYQWDGASGPTIDTKNTIAASLVHDCLYQIVEVSHLAKYNGFRKYADKVFYDHLRADGMSKFRAGYFYYALRIFYPVYRFIFGRR